MHFCRHSLFAIATQCTHIWVGQSVGVLTDRKSIALAERGGKTPIVRNVVITGFHGIFTSQWPSSQIAMGPQRFMCLFPLFISRLSFYLTFLSFKVGERAKKKDGVQEQDVLVRHLVVKQSARTGPGWRGGRWPLLGIIMIFMLRCCDCHSGVQMLCGLTGKEQCDAAHRPHRTYE